MLWLPSPPVTRPLALRWLPTVIAVAVLATAGPLGWDKDFGTFLVVRQHALRTGDPSSRLTPGRMYTRVLFTAVAALIGLGTVAKSDTLAGGPVYGGPSSVGGTVTCRVFNAGQGSLSLDSREIACVRRQRDHTAHIVDAQARAEDD
jgi:hypothetical protein